SIATSSNERLPPRMSRSGSSATYDTGVCEPPPPLPPVAFEPPVLGAPPVSAPLAPGAPASAAAPPALSPPFSAPACASVVPACPAPSAGVLGTPPALGAAVSPLVPPLPL